MAMKMTEMSRDNKHEEDVMTRSMFETLCECEGKPSLLSSTARPKRQLSVTAARAGGSDPSQTKRSRMGRGRRQRWNGGCIGDNNNYERLHTMHKKTIRHA